MGSYSDSICDEIDSLLKTIELLSSGWTKPNVFYESLQKAEYAKKMVRELDDMAHPPKTTP